MIKTICDICEFYPCTDDRKKPLWIKCPCYSPIPKPPTNGDRIRSMTDDELADWISSFCTCGEFDDICPAVNCKGCGSDNCSVAWLDWLKQEADKEGER